MFLLCFKAQSNNLVKEIKTKEKLEDRIKIDHEQMDKLKSEHFSIKNNLKKAETTIEKLNETLKDLRVINITLMSTVYCIIRKIILIQSIFCFCVFRSQITI